MAATTILSVLIIFAISVAVGSLVSARRDGSPHSASGSETETGEIIDETEAGDRASEEIDPKYYGLKLRNPPKAIPDKFLVLNIQTSGLHPENDEILEIGVLRAFTHGNVADGFHGYILPEKDIPAKISKINGLTLEKLIENEAENLTTTLRQLRDWLQPDEREFVVFNGEFENRFLLAAKRKTKVQIPTKVVSTQEFAQKFFPDLTSHRLEDIWSTGGKKEPDRGSVSMNKCAKTARVYIATLQRYQQLYAQAFSEEK